MTRSCPYEPTLRVGIGFCQRQKTGLRECNAEAVNGSWYKHIGSGVLQSSANALMKTWWLGDQKPLQLRLPLLLIFTYASTVSLHSTTLEERREAESFTVECAFAVFKDILTFFLIIFFIIISTTVNQAFKNNVLVLCKGAALTA